MDVTIRGTLTPSTWLGRGEVAKVRYDDQIQRWITGGFVEVVKWHEPKPKAKRSSKAERTESTAEPPQFHDPGTVQA